MFFLQEEKDIGDQKYESHLMNIRHLKPKLITNLNYQQDYILRRKQKRKKQRSKIKHSNQQTFSAIDTESCKNCQQFGSNSQALNTRIQHRGIFKSVYDGNDKVSGYWLNGLLHGDAEIQYSNGDYFTGKFQKGCKLEGKMVYKDQGTYQGQFFNEQFHGNGILELKDKKISCQWLNGIPQGNCVVQYSSGTVYYGQLKDFKKHGFGYIYFPNDTKFVGQFTDGQIKGYGQYFQKGVLKCKGIWKDGILLQQKKDDQWQKIDKQDSVNWSIFQPLLNQTNRSHQGAEIFVNAASEEKMNSTSNSQGQKYFHRKSGQKKITPLSIFNFLKIKEDTPIQQNLQ